MTPRDPNDVGKPPLLPALLLLLLVAGCSSHPIVTYEVTHSSGKVDTLRANADGWQDLTGSFYRNDTLVFSVKRDSLSSIRILGAKP